MIFTFYFQKQTGIFVYFFRIKQKSSRIYYAKDFKDLWWLKNNNNNNNNQTKNINFKAWKSSKLDIDDFHKIVTDCEALCSLLLSIPVSGILKPANREGNKPGQIIFYRIYSAWAGSALISHRFTRSRSKKPPPDLKKWSHIISHPRHVEDPCWLVQTGMRSGGKIRSGFVCFFRVNRSSVRENRLNVWIHCMEQSDIQL